MPIHNPDIARVFQNIADLLEIGNADPFRIRAYRNAARTVGECNVELAELIERGEPLPKIPGVGADLAGKIKEICTTGQCSALTDLQREVPPAIAGLLAIPGMGPKRVQTLYRELAISTPEQLLECAQRGAIRELRGFGARVEQKILEAVSRHSQRDTRTLRAMAKPYVESLLGRLRRLPEVIRADTAGSYRRGRDTVGDIDLVVSARSGGAVCQAFAAFDEVGEVLARGRTRASVVLKSGLQVDLRVVEDASFGAALLYFTGSKPHNIALRRIAQGRGLKINEYGIYRGEKRLAGAEEADVYAVLDLPWIAPELREDRGEIDAARDGHLPRLLERAQMRGDLHMHTRASDGRADIRSMALAARALGHEYVAITDHSQRLRVTNGLDVARLRRQMAEIDRLQRNEELGITLLKGIEVDILRDGSLDLPDAVLEQLDIVIGAVHSHFDLPRREQTERLLRALEHPVLDVLAHPGCRLIGQREPCDFDFQAVLRQAAKHHCALELDAQPERLDLTENDCRAAKEHGVPICIDSDAHSTEGLRYLDDGVIQARRGWIETADVLNTFPLAKLRSWLHPHPHARAPRGRA